MYANRRRVQGERGKSLLRRRGELLERPFAHQYETGAMRRLHVRGRDNVAKRVLLQATAFNLALILRSITKAGTAKGLTDIRRNLFFALCAFWQLSAPLPADSSPILTTSDFRVRPRTHSRHSCRYRNRGSDTGC